MICYQDIRRQTLVGQVQTVLARLPLDDFVAEVDQHICGRYSHEVLIIDYQSSPETGLSDGSDSQ